MPQVRRRSISFASLCFGTLILTTWRRFPPAPSCHASTRGLAPFVEDVETDKTAIGDRFSEDEIHVVCPWHGWEYDLENDACATDRRFKLRSFRIVLREDYVYVLV